MRNIAVLGGGISGLSTAYFLHKKFPNALIQIVESDHWGGWIRSVHREDTLFETGPRTLRPHGTPGAFTLNLIHELQLEKRLLRVSKSSVAAKNRFVYSQSQLQKLPSSILGILLERPKIFNGIPMEILHEFFNKKSRRVNATDESIQCFFERRFGKNTANLASAIIHGIYAGDVNQLSVKSTLGFLTDLEEKYGSIGKGILKSGFSFSKSMDKSQWEGSGFVKDVQSSSSIYSFKDGLEELPRKIFQVLQKSSNVKLIQDKCMEIVLETHGKPKVITKTGVIEADNIISALPAHVLSDLVSKSLPDISQILKGIPSVTVGVVNLVYPGFVKLPVSGFGYLIPKSENERESILGTIFDSDGMPLQSRIPKTRLTVMMGGYRFDSLFGVPEKVSHDSLRDLAVTAVKKHLGIKFEPEDFLVNIHQKCIPQYLVGHREKMHFLHNLILSHPKGRNQLAVAGASYTGVSVNDCIYESFRSVEKISQDGFITGLEKFT